MKAPLLETTSAPSYLNSHRKENPARRRFLDGVSAMWISDIVFEVIVRRFKPNSDE